MSGTPQQHRNACRIRNALRNYQCYRRIRGKWTRIGPLEYFVARDMRKSGGSCCLMKIQISVIAKDERWEEKIAG